MNTSNESQKKMQNGYLGSKTRTLTFAYRVGNGIYINLTNRCTNDCTFCLRNNGETAYGSNSLWLEREPTSQEVIEAVEAIYFQECDSFVFCGFGEPTCRFDTLIEVAKLLKEKYTQPIRLNTNGQADLITNTNSAKRLEGLIDSVSISLNSANEDDYDALCHPVFGKKAYDAMFDFGKNCVGVIPTVIFSVVEETLSEDDIEKCRKKVESIGARLRVRKFISENDKNPEEK